MATQQRGRVGEPENTRLPLMGAYSNRGHSPDKDQRFVNMFPETRKVEQLENTKIFINKRPGLSLYRDFGTGQGRGLAYFNNKFYVAIGNKIYEDAVSPVEKVTLTSSNGPLGMIVCNSASLGDYLFICDGTSGWFIKTDGVVTPIVMDSLKTVVLTAGGTGYTNGTYALSFTGGGGTGAAGTYTVTTNTVTSITISNYGSGYTSPPTIGFPSGGGTNAAAVATINAFPSPHSPAPTFIDGYVILAKGSDVYNCDLDNPASWTTSNYLTAEMFPDPVRALARQNNQVVVFGSSSIEFFYDAANASGSPLSRNDSTTIQMGTAAPYCIYQNEKFCAYISQSDSGGRAVWLIEGFQPKKVSDEYIERILDAETDMSDVRGFGLRTKGHMFYVINLPTLNRTLVYDTDEKLWHEWSSNSAGSHTVFGCDHMADNGTGAAYLLHNSNGCLYKLDPNVYTDDGTTILCELVTNRYDMDTYNRKFMSSCKIVGDRSATSNPIILTWSDDDYQTWSNEKTIDTNDDFPAFHRMGSFRRRAFKLKHTQDAPCRVESLEVIYTKGTS
jgi:hypothetical protein